MDGHTKTAGISAGLVALVLTGCAHVTGSDGERRSGASVVVSTAHGARQGELFAVDDQRIWLCDDGVAVEVPKAQLVTALAPSTAPLDVTHPELWAGMARHPEGLPPEGASCGAAHDDAPAAQVVATTWDGTVQDLLLAVSPTSLVVEVAHVPRCLPRSELADLKMALTQYGPERLVKPAPELVPEVDEDDALTAGLAAARVVAMPIEFAANAAADLGLDVVVAPPLLAVAGALALVAGVTVLQQEDEGVFAYRTRLVHIDLRRVATLKAFARYPTGAPPWLRCPPLLGDSP
jgi:hypothetical protein